MRTMALQSGSNGNSIYVESDGVRLLFDAGISGIRAERLLAAEGIDIRGVNAIIISHDHNDHVHCAGIYQRKYGPSLYMTRKTLRAAADLGKIRDLNHFKSGEKLKFGKVSVETVRTPHDAADGCVFVIDNGRWRLGILTDLGHVFSGLADILESLDAV